MILNLLTKFLVCALSELKHYIQNEQSEQKKTTTVNCYQVVLIWRHRFYPEKGALYGYLNRPGCLSWWNRHFSPYFAKSLSWFSTHKCFNHSSNAKRIDCCSIVDFIHACVNTCSKKTEKGLAYKRSVSLPSLKDWNGKTDASKFWTILDWLPTSSTKMQDVNSTENLSLKLD